MLSSRGWPSRRRRFLTLRWVDVERTPQGPVSARFGWLGYVEPRVHRPKSARFGWLGCVEPRVHLQPGDCSRRTTGTSKTATACALWLQNSTSLPGRTDAWTRHCFLCYKLRYRGCHCKPHCLGRPRRTHAYASRTYCVSSVPYGCCVKCRRTS